MKSMVLDASVIIKWVFPEQAKEEHVPQALSILRDIQLGTIKIIQPIPWLVEVTAVIVRLQPKIAIETFDLLSAMSFPTIETAEVSHLACKLSERYDHHLFDTLYHAAALYQGNTTLITADEKYFRKAQKQGSIRRLADFSIFDD